MGDASLGIGVQALPAAIGQILVLHGKADAAVDPSQQPLIAQLVHDTADGLLRDVELPGEMLDRGKAFLAHDLQNSALALCGDLQHGTPLSPKRIIRTVWMQFLFHMSNLYVHMNLGKQRTRMFRHGREGAKRTSWPCRTG